ncbi:BTB/POZ domain-containing protein [Rhizophagus clarus]|uniref:BTB/POZ domain-containing protein n=1 Tax=Rhizophagus clarus TaxID=94130 RepID=A0A8H3L2P0_9GLOM|nr:BTB/POZ domain-containing protein [Rhizophagus clarus]
MSQQNNQIHYYIDGDVLFIVEDTKFRVHKNIIGLASKMFNDMFTCATPTQSDSDNIPEVELEGESTEFLRFSEKYIIDSVLLSAMKFLEREFRKNPLYSLFLADRYHFKSIYKESSKLVLDKFPEYKRNEIFSQLSLYTRNCLIKKYTSYTDSLAKLANVDFTSGYLHCDECNKQSEHDLKINQEFIERSKQVQILPLPLPPTPPSGTRKILFNSIGYKTCDNQFMTFQLPRKFKKHFGVFEPLECKKHKKDPKFYLYIELGE